MSINNFIKTLLDDGSMGLIIKNKKEMPERSYEFKFQNDNPIKRIFVVCEENSSSFHDIPKVGSRYHSLYFTATAHYNIRITLNNFDAEDKYDGAIFILTSNNLPIVSLGVYKAIQAGIAKESILIQVKNILNTTAIDDVFGNYYGLRISKNQLHNFHNLITNIYLDDSDLPPLCDLNCDDGVDDGVDDNSEYVEVVDGVNSQKI
jgi:hypothetical protein